MFWRRRRSADDFHEEIRAHLQLQTDELKAEGWNEPEARSAARKAFGNITRVEERFYEHGHILWLEDLLRDVRYGLGAMRRNPGFTLAAVLTLALGIGINTTIFSFVNALLLRPLPLPDSNRLLSIYTSDYSGPLYGSSSYPDFLDFRDHSRVFSGVTAYSIEPMSLSGSGVSAQRVMGNSVTRNYFSVLGVKTIRGRTFLPDDEDVAVLSYGLWRRNFGSNPEIVGRDIVLQGKPFRVAGIAPKGFTGLVRGIPTDIWVPLAAGVGAATADRLVSRDSRWLAVVGRLSAGVDLNQAQAAFRLMATRLHEAYPQDWTDVRKDGRRITLRPANEALMINRAGVVEFLTILMVVVAIVLLLSCVNVANLLLARATTRTKEMSIRLSLGAGRFRLVRQLLAESALLSLIAGTAGVLLAFWATGLLMRFRPPLPMPVELDLGFDTRVLGFALIISLATILIFGVAPAIRMTRPDLISATKETSPGLNRRSARIFNLRNMMTTVQIALSLLLLVGAGLFVRSLVEAASIDIGFKPNNVVLASMNLDLQGYNESRGMTFYRQLLEQTDALPGVKSASLAQIVPLGLRGQRTQVAIEGYTPRNGEDMELNVNRVSPRYFETMGISIIKGRAFTARDREGTPGVVIVNEALARRYWPGEDPLGKRIRDDKADLTVVGVARDGKYRSLSEEPLPYFYLPLFQHYEGRMTLHVRTYGNSAATIRAIRHQVHTLDKDLPLFDVKTMEDHLAIAFLPSRIMAALLGSFGILALLLAVVGIYGVMSYAVSQRTREVGIRMALGARMSNVIRMILRQGMIVVGIGLVVGMGAAISLTRFTSSLLYGISPTDPWTLAGVLLLLAIAGLSATLVPALRAARIHPMEALRHE